MPLGTNGTSIYRPATAPPGTVCTGNGIGVEVRDDEGNVLFVVGLYDGKIYAGAWWDDPGLQTVQRATIINGVVVSQPTQTTVVIDGVEYHQIFFMNRDGQWQELNLRADLVEDIGKGDLNGMLASVILGAALVDLLPALITSVPDMDNDGDYDLQDWSAVLENTFNGLADANYAGNDNANGLIYEWMANNLPDIISDIGGVGDNAQGDDNQPPPGDGGGGGGGAGGLGGDDWFL